MKNPNVCKDCKYRSSDYQYNNRYRNNCDYLSITGHSRIVIEMENGGVQEDSCICYEKKPREKRREGLKYSHSKGCTNSERTGN